MRISGKRFVQAFVIVLVPMLGMDCGGAAKPVTQPNAVVQVANGADLAIKAADAALPVIESLTPNPIPRKTMIAIAKATEGIGKGGQSLATVLTAYVKSRGTSDWSKVTGAILGIQQTLDAALVDLPEPTRTQVRGILAPVTAALLTILATLPPPAVQSAGFIDCYGRVDAQGRCVVAPAGPVGDGQTYADWLPVSAEGPLKGHWLTCGAGQVISSWDIQDGVVKSITCTPPPPDRKVSEYLRINAAELFID